MGRTEIERVPMLECLTDASAVAKPINAEGPHSEPKVKHMDMRAI